MLGALLVNISVKISSKSSTQDLLGAPTELSLPFLRPWTGEDMKLRHNNW